MIQSKESSTHATLKTLIQQDHYYLARDIDMEPNLFVTFISLLTARAKDPKMLAPRP